MQINAITSQSSPLLKRIRALHIRQNREKTGQFLIEGAKLVAEAAAKDIAIKEVLVSQTFLKQGPGGAESAAIARLSMVDDRIFQELCSTDSSCGILAIADIPRWSNESIFAGNSSLVVIAHAIQDPGNLGTIIRAALAAGASGMIMTKGTVDPFNPKVVRSAAGALFKLPHLMEITIDDAFKAAKAHGLKVIACDPLAEKIYWEADMKGPLALTFGNEGQGFHQAVLARSDECVSVPMREGSESLNVAMSAGIVLFGAVQQRISRAPNG